MKWTPHRPISTRAAGNTPGGSLFSDGATVKKASKKRAAKKGHSKRLDPLKYGIDLEAIVQEIKPHLLPEMTLAEIGEKAGLSRMVVSHILNGHGSLSLGAIAALAKASGGRLVVKYEAPKNS